MVTIRTATVHDHPAVRDLTCAAYIDAGHLDPSSPYSQTLADIAARQDGLWVAEVDGTVAGAVNIAAPGSDMAEIAYDNELEFRMLAVHPDYQRRGVGRALVEHILQTARDHQLDRVALTTMASMTTAHAMYQAMGFQRAPDRDWNLHTAGIVDHHEGLETFLVYVHPLN